MMNVMMVMNVRMAGSEGGRTLHRAHVGQGPLWVLIGWPRPLGFGLDGRSLLVRRGKSPAGSIFILPGFR